MIPTHLPGHPRGGWSVALEGELDEGGDGGVESGEPEAGSGSPLETPAKALLLKIIIIKK